jgi:hypothetical protein
MKKLLTVVLLLVPVGIMAQTASANGSSSSSMTSALGNNQAVTFSSSSPSEITTNANIKSTSTSTNNLITSGTTTNIVDYKGEYTLKNVPSVSGPQLTTSNDTCMGSSSGSANGPGFGISFGTTWTDEQCKRLKMSRELWNKGMKAASLAIDCMDAGAREALEMTGTKCPQSMTAEERRASFGLQTSVVGAAPSPAPKPVSVTPVAVNAAPNNTQPPGAPQAAAMVAAPSPAPRSEPVTPAIANTEPLNKLATNDHQTSTMETVPSLAPKSESATPTANTEPQSSQAPGDASTNADRTDKNIASRRTVDSAGSSTGNTVQN